MSCSLQVKRCAADHYPGPRLGTANSGDRAGVLIVCRQGRSTPVIAYSDRLDGDQLADLVDPVLGIAEFI